MSTERKAAAILVDCLLANGVSQVFGVPGESYLDVLDAFYDERERIDFMGCRQEGGAAYMAEAWGKLTAEPGICFVTRGPGATNAAIGVHTAMQNSSPMILFVGQVGRGERDREAFQEIDYRAFYSPICKWATEIDNPDRIPELVARAFAVARSGRPGPVVVALPEDMLAQASQVQAQAATPVHLGEASAGVMAQLQDRLRAAQRPLLMVGGSHWSDAAKAALQAFASSQDIPVVSAFRFNDVFDNRNEHYAGDAGVGMTAATRSLLQNADFLLVVGARLGEMTTAGYSLLQVPQPEQQLVHVYPDVSEIGKVYQAHLAINASVNHFALQLQNIKADKPADRADWRARARDAWLEGLNAPAQPGALDMGQVMQWLREHLPQDTIVTNGAGNFSIWPNKFLAFGRDARLLAPQSGAMGYGVPAAIAAKKRYPDRTVVCFTGDGDFQMNSQELGSSLQAGVQPIILLVNNNMYGTIRMHQERHFPARISGTSIVNPNFIELAQAYGYVAERITQTADFAAAFERALTSDTGALLELVVDAQILTPHQTIEQARQAAGAR